MSKDKPSLYELLGVLSTASQDEIKKAYRQASLTNHPDRHGAEKREEKTHKMQEINHAYEVLSDPQKRQKYDEAGQHPTGQASGGYCAGCDDDPCTCFIFKPAGSAKRPRTSQRSRRPPTTCFGCHRDVSGIRHIQVSCGCCLWCHECADRAFQARPDKTQRTLHVRNEIAFEEVEHILSRDVWHDCNLARRPICHCCRTPSADFVTCLCPEHRWCPSCFNLIYSVATKNPRCCDRMVGYSTIVEHLPQPIAALYEMRYRSGFKPWREPELQEKLMRAQKNWQNQNPHLIFGAAALEALEQKDAQIRHLEAQLRVYAEASSQKAEEGAAEPPTRDLKDELVRKNMRMEDLERSNKILRTENTEEITKFSEAAKARKVAVVNEAALRKENKELADQLAAARSEPGQHPATKGKGKGEDKNNNCHASADLFAAQEARRIVVDNNTAAQKRVKDLETETAGLRSTYIIGNGNLFNPEGVLKRKPKRFIVVSKTTSRDCEVESNDLRAEVSVKFAPPKGGFDSSFQQHITLECML